MAPENKKNQFFFFLSTIFQPSKSIIGITARRQAQLTTISALPMALVSLIAGLLLAIFGQGIGIFFALFFLTAIFAVAVFLGRTDNFLIGSTLLVSGLIVGGFILSSFYPEGVVGFLLSTILPALALGMVLLPVVSIIIISGLTLLTLGTLPLMAVLDLNTGAFLFFSLLINEAVFVLVSIFRDRTDDQLLEEVNGLKRRLDERLFERTRSSRITSDIAQEIASATTTEDMLRQTVNLIVGRLGYTFAGIYLSDEETRTSNLVVAQGSEAEKLLAAGRIIPHGPPQPVGWVAKNQELYKQTLTVEDALNLELDFIGDSQASIYLPILGRDQLIGVMNVQHQRSTAFDNEAIVALETFSNQIATTIANVRVFESEQGSIKEVASIYRAGFPIARAVKDSEIAQAIDEVLQSSSFISMFLIEENGTLVIRSSSRKAIGANVTLPASINLSLAELQPALSSGIFYGEGSRLNSLPYNLLRILRQLNVFSAALVPIKDRGTINALILIATTENTPLSEVNILPFINIAELASNANERIFEAGNTQRRIIELETLTQVSQEISAIWDVKTLYRTLHLRIRQAFGDVNFNISLFDAATGSISNPYLYDKSNRAEEVSSIEAHPLEEDLISTIIRTRQALLLSDNVLNRAAEMGVRLLGKGPKSWLGVPMIISGEVIGAIVVEDLAQEHAFDETDLRFMTTMTAQVAGAIHNLRLLSETRNRALQLQTASEIARDISGSLDIGELLVEAVNLIRDRFDFYHAAIFLLDPLGEFALIREATGEAGVQMKRAGHKLKVGSKSIVGYVTGSGEPLVVNDTSRDATYYANPLLPETRSETAVPLRVGQRILGAIDVQSTQPFAFNDDNINVLRILADQLAIAVINSELFAETQEHLSRHRLLHHVTTAAASGTTLDEALIGAAQGLQVTLGGDHVAILLADKGQQILEVRATAGYSEEVKQLIIPYGKGITGWVAVNQRAQRIDDVTQDARYIQAGSNVKSELVIPLTYRGELLGVLNVESDEVAAYTENDEEMLGTLGGSLAAIITNARLVEQVRRQVERERLLYEITSKIRRSTDMQTIMNTTASELTKALGVKKAKIKINISDDAAQNRDQTK
jgi:GAF domain-containing protein